MATTTQSDYQDAGSIEPPRLLGRLLRLLLGVICLDLVRQIVADIPGIIQRGWPLNLVSIGIVILGFFLLRPVVNLGTTAKNTLIPQIAVASGTALTLLIDWILGRPLFGEVFTAFLLLWMSYVYGHLGISFVLAAIIKTPGCEMRAIPHLLALLRGKEALEHHCPGFLRHVDRWEYGLKKKN